jgi:hypothetical protein
MVSVDMQVVNLPRVSLGRILGSSIALVFSFFSKTWMLGYPSTKPLAVTLPICPLIALGASVAATHIGKLASASVNFFQTLGLTDTKTI